MCRAAALLIYSINGINQRLLKNAVFAPGAGFVRSAAAVQGLPVEALFCFVGRQAFARHKAILLPGCFRPI